MGKALIAGDENPAAMSVLMVITSPEASVPVVINPILSEAGAVAVAGVYLPESIPFDEPITVAITPAKISPEAFARKVTPAGNVIIVWIPLTNEAVFPCREIVSILVVAPTACSDELEIDVIPV